MRLLFMLLVGYILWRMVRGRKEVEAPAAPKDEEAQLDPVCGVYVPASEAVVGTHEGKRIYFCSMECLEKYRERLGSPS